ncbi:sigma-70 family RNA polymerase sigma factor [Thermoproteota archaeon]
MKKTDAVWHSIRDKVLTNVKIHLLRHNVDDILTNFRSRLDYIVSRYLNHLPRYVAASELDDLKTIARIELLETLKVWDSSEYKDIWPLAQARILGAMKDYIRYLTRTDPSRFYDWIVDAAYMYMTVNSKSDFESKIETGIELNRAMRILTLREKKIVLLHTKEDVTFKEIGEKFDLSESQVSRIYKRCIEKIKGALG